MESGSAPVSPAVSPEIRTAMLQWFRFTNQAMADAVNISKPLFDAYMQGLDRIMPNLGNFSGKYCEIPETECPPYCVCEMEWDACQGDLVNGSIAISNTGEQGINFTLSAGSFRSRHDDSGIKPKLDPDNFTLQPGESKAVAVSISLDGNFDPQQSYESEVKIAGRYEQCVHLRLHVRRRQSPRCEVKHGEIPTHVVAHHWYDHFQCEELCFRPVTRGRIEPLPTENDDNVIERPVKKKARAAARRVNKRKGGS